jgi:lipopolysaccharide/colanic/teichoic acid biosynthesis glycosyltransferase
LRAQKITKRGLDLVLGACILLASLPLLVLVAGIARVCHGRPVWFRQVRSGLGGRQFTVLKFRTMRPASQGSPLPDDDRMTPLGAFLRRTSIDELPELWNIFRGEMSLVGPRPLLMEYNERYSPYQARRLEVKPGITGLAQVSGRNALTWEQKFDLDVWYVDHWSLWLDLKILAKTIWNVVTGRGVAAPGHVTMPRFGEKQRG